MEREKTNEHEQEVIMHIGKLLRKYVESKYPNKSEYARLLGVSPQSLNGYFNSENIRHSILLKMAEVEGMTVLEFTVMLSAHDE